jgi:hypothetical protein
VVEVRLEPVDGYFIEGFDIGLRFETGDGEVVAALRWSDAVRASTPHPPLDAYYRTVLEQAMPAGAGAVLASVSIGAAAGPATPDPAGPLDCRLDLDVGPGERVAVEVSFTGSDCLRLVG